MTQVYNSKTVGAEDRELGTRVRWPVPNVISRIYSFGKVRPAVCRRHVYIHVRHNEKSMSEKYDLKIPTSFGETSFALRQKLLKI